MDRMYFPNVEAMQGLVAFDERLPNPNTYPRHYYLLPTPFHGRSGCIKGQDSFSESEVVTSIEFRKETLVLPGHIRLSFWRKVGNQMG